MFCFSVSVSGTWTIRTSIKILIKVNWFSTQTTWILKSSVSGSGSVVFDYELMFGGRKRYDFMCTHVCFIRFHFVVSTCTLLFPLNVNSAAKMVVFDSDFVISVQTFIRHENYQIQIHIQGQTLLPYSWAENGYSRTEKNYNSISVASFGPVLLTVSANGAMSLVIKLLRFLNKPSELLQKWVATPIDQIWLKCWPWCSESIIRVFPLLYKVGNVGNKGLHREEQPGILQLVLHSPTYLAELTWHLLVRLRLLRSLYSHAQLILSKSSKSYNQLVQSDVKYPSFNT